MVDSVSSIPVSPGTYNQTDPSSAKDQVRTLVGDCDPPFRVGDAEISFLISLYGTDYYHLIKAAIACCEKLAGAYGKLSDITIGGFNVNYRFQHMNFTSQITTLQQYAQMYLREHPGTTWAPFMDGGGINSNPNQQGPMLTNDNTAWGELPTRLQVFHNDPDALDLDALSFLWNPGP